MFYLVCSLFGFTIGAGLIYSILNPKREKIKTLNKEIEIQNSEAIKKLKSIENEIDSLNFEYKRKQENYKDLIENQNKLFESKQKEYRKLIEDIEKNHKVAENAAKKYYDKMMNLQKEKLAIDLQKEEEKFQEAQEEYALEYTTLLDDVAKTVFNEVMDGRNQIDKLNSKLFDLQNKVNAAIEANKRAEEIKNKENFYKLNLSNEDIEEISELRKLHLRYKEPLNKVIWKVYYEKPCSDLINRVVGQGNHCGIYKITNLKNNMCYVGQAVDIANRWKQHIKRGIGAETPTRNKLYPAMLENGVENFSFEIIEECERGLLNEREDYWQEYFGAKEFGYSIK